MTLADNALLTASGQGLVNRGLIRFGRVREFSREVIRRFGVRCNDESSTAGSLSGGNLQKYIIGREALQNPVCWWRRTLPGALMSALRWLSMKLWSNCGMPGLLLF